jgi:hypothetical protein
VRDEATRRGDSEAGPLSSPFRQAAPAFVARTKAEVDALYAAVLKSGGTDNGAAGLRRPRYYAHSAIYFAAFANQIYTNGPDKVAGNTQHAAEVLARN